MALPTICLMGPTASGKTRLSFAIAERMPVEIISVDSALVYQGLDIGAAKPTAKELAIVPHHLIDICQPSEPFSAAQFVESAVALIAEIQSKGKIPLLVGGTMLYYKALLQGLSALPEADASTRAEIATKAQQQGWPALHKALAEVDPDSAQRIHQNDTQRLQRAWEVYLLTGKTLTQLQSEQTHQHDIGDVIQLALDIPDRARLHEDIAKRFYQMLDNGFVDEVKSLYERGLLDEESPAGRSVGYRQILGHLRGDYDYAVMAEKAIAATRQLAKRQLTWLRHWPGASIFDAYSATLLENVMSYLDEQLAKPK